MSIAADRFDDWIRTRFVEYNTELEELYFSQDDPAHVEGVGDTIKTDLALQGREMIAPLISEGNTEQRFDSAYNVLGNLGLFMAALRRHELTNPDREDASPYDDCSALGMHIAASIGVAPRFATAHLSTHSKAINGVKKSFTSLKDEELFNTYNLYGILSFKRAGEALMHIPAMGISSPGSKIMLEQAQSALEQVVVYNKHLFDSLDVKRFFYSIRPYFKPYRVGKSVYRGANAGDFAEINQIDLLLGLCRGNDPHYAQILEEKILFMPPDDQHALRKSLSMKPLLDEFLDVASIHSQEPWYQEHGRLFLEVCKVHGRTATQHHNMLVKRFIEQPATGIDDSHLKQVTASGPPLPVLIKSLEHLRDLRTGARRDDIETAYEKLSTLSKSVGEEAW